MTPSIKFTNWGEKETKATQRTDPYLKRVLELLENPILDRTACRRIRRRYAVIDGLLHKTPNKNNPYFRLCIPITMIRRVLFEVHGGATIHFGHKKSLWRAYQQFDWCGMYSDIKRYVKTCHQCQTRKPSRPTTIVPQGITEVVTDVFHTVTSDIITSLPLTKKGHSPGLVSAQSLGLRTPLKPGNVVKIRKEALNNITANQLYNQSRANIGRTPTVIKIGDSEAIELSAVKMGRHAKRKDHWSKPYKAIDIKCPQNLTVIQTIGQKIKKKIQSSHTKLYNSRLDFALFLERSDPTELELRTVRKEMSTSGSSIKTNQNKRLGTNNNIRTITSPLLTVRCQCPKGCPNEHWENIGTIEDTEELKQPINQYRLFSRKNKFLKVIQSERKFGIKYSRRKVRLKNRLHFIGRSKVGAKQSYVKRLDQHNWLAFNREISTKVKFIKIKTEDNLYRIDREIPPKRNTRKGSDPKATEIQKVVPTEEEKRSDFAKELRALWPPEHRKEFKNLTDEQLAIPYFGYFDSDDEGFEEVERPAQFYAKKGRYYSLPEGERDPYYAEVVRNWEYKTPNFRVVRTMNGDRHRNSTHEFVSRHITKKYVPRYRQKAIMESNETAQKYVENHYKEMNINFDLRAQPTTFENVKMPDDLEKINCYICHQACVPLPIKCQKEKETLKETYYHLHCHQQRLWKNERGQCLAVDRQRCTSNHCSLFMERKLLDLNLLNEDELKVLMEYTYVCPECPPDVPECQQWIFTAGDHAQKHQTDEKNKKRRTSRKRKSVEPATTTKEKKVKLSPAPSEKTGKEETPQKDPELERNTRNK